MTVTADSFRQNYPAFKSDTMYPSQVIDYYLTLAGLLLSEPRWTTALDMGTELFVAHHIVLEKQAMDAAATGAAPGVGIGGPVGGKSTGPISISYNTEAAVELGAGHWNQTVYGTRFIRLARMMGAGGLQLGVGYCPSASAFVTAWGGPPVWPGW